MSEVASAFVGLRADASGFGRSLDSQIGGQLTQSGKKAGGLFGSALKVGAVGVLAGAAALGGFLKGSLDEARDAQKVGALTNAVIKSTGGIANVTAGQVDKLATSISLKTGVDDEAIASGENMLLTFGNVRNEIGKGNDIFNQATVAANDMAAAFGGDAVSNSKMLGKALNDPTKGVSALTRVGVSFTQQQKDQIKTLQESGDLLGAQKIILGEVSKQTKGAAESQATLGAKAKVAFGNLQETVGTALLPLWDKALAAATGFLLFITANIGPAFSSIGGFIAPIKAAIEGLFASGGQGGGLLDTFTSLATSIQANFLPVLLTAADTFQGVVLPAILAVGSYLVSNLLPIFQQVAGIIGSQVVPIIATLAKFFYGTLYPAVIAIVSAIAVNLKPVLDQLFATIQAKILPAISQLLAKFQEWWPTIQKVITVVLQVVGVILIFAAAILGKVLPPLIAFIGWLIGGLIGAIGTVIGWIVKIVAFIIKIGTAFVKAVVLITKFQVGVIKIIGKVIAFVAALPGKVVNALKSLASKLVGVAVKAFSSMASSVSKGISKVIGFVKEVPGKAFDALKTLGTKLFNAAKAAFVSMGQAEVRGITKVVNFVKEVPDKAKNALGDLGSVLLQKGKDLIQGLIDGIASKIEEAVQKVKDGLQHIKDLLPGSPIKAGPLKSWNNTGPTGPGGRLIGLLASGLENQSPIDTAMMNLTRRINVPRVGLADIHASSSGAGSAGGRVPTIHVENMYTRDEKAAAYALRVEQAKALALMGTP